MCKLDKKYLSFLATVDENELACPTFPAHCSHSFGFEGLFRPGAEKAASCFICEQTCRTNAAARDSFVSMHS